MKRNRYFLLIICVLLSISKLVAQQIDVSGSVYDENGDALPGATIQIKGTSTGTITDVTGTYSLSAATNDTLLVSFVGYITQFIPIQARSIIDVNLALDIQSLSEVVVVGYGTQKKSDLISSVASVEADEMMKVPTADIGQMIRGKAPGVLVTLGNARPGGSSNILIRGKNSIGGGNAPIVIVDGVPVGDINDVNPNDIASLEILKDAAAQAIYGARASNGVILITTKRGKEGEVSVGYNGYFGAQTIKRNFDVYSGEEFADLRREAHRTLNGGVDYLPDEEIFTALELESLQNGEFIDWEKEIFRVAPIQNHNLSISSGSEKTKVYSGINYLKQEGVVPGTDFERVILRLNADQKIFDWLTFGLNTSYQISISNNPGTGNTLQRSVTTSPLGKIYEDDGVTYRVRPGGVQESYNPLLDINEVTNESRDEKNLINLFLDVTPFEGFKYRFNASRRSWNQKAYGYATKDSYAGVLSGFGSGSVVFQDNKEYQIENILTYNTSIQSHNFGVTFVQSIIESEYSRFGNYSSNIPNDLLKIYGIETAFIQNPDIGASRRGLVSFVGRLQYDYDGTYFVTLSGRADGSSVFGANNKWAYFPAIGIGWNVHRAAFMNELNLISNLKLRASYGSVGNQAIAPYQSQSTANQMNYLVDGQKVIGYAPGDYLPNPNLKWETSTTLNLALDFGLWFNRLSGTVEYYNTRTKDLLVTQTMNAGLGYTKMWNNLGEVENKGLELALNVIAVEKKDFTVEMGVQFSRNRNKIISLYGVDEDGDGVEDDDVGNLWFIGQPIDVYYDFKAEGIFQEGEDGGFHQPDAQPGDVKLYDRYRNDRAPLSDEDRVITKKDPDWFGSANIDIKYRNFDFSISAIAVQGVIKLNPYLYSYNYGGSLRSVLNGIKQDYWLPENPNGNWPRPNEANDPAYIRTLAYQDASYFRIQNLTLGYSLGEETLSRMKLSKLRVYVTAQNPLTVTDYQSYSPEKNASDYPEAISVIGGIQLGF